MPKIKGRVSTRRTIHLGDALVSQFAAPYEDRVQRRKCSIIEHNPKLPVWVAESEGSTVGQVVSKLEWDELGRQPLPVGWACSDCIDRITGL